MSDELTTKQLIEDTESAIADWEEGGGYRGEYDFDAERALVKDLRTLLEITKTALEPNMTVRCPSSITHPERRCASRRITSTSMFSMTSLP